MPAGPVDAFDVADPDDPLLMTPVASWKGRRSQLQLPCGVPLAPDRQCHEEQGVVSWVMLGQITTLLV